jgi:hypothetical protein
VDGVPTNVGGVTVGVVDAAGTVVVASGTATVNNANGTYSYQLASQPTAGVLKATWTRVDTGAQLDMVLEVVGSQLFTLADARGFRAAGNQTPFSSAATYPDSFLAEWRDRVTAQFESVSGRSWTRRYARVQVAGNGGPRLLIHRGLARTVWGGPAGGPGRFRDIGEVLSVTVSGVSVDPAQVVADGSYLHRTSGVWTLPNQANPLNVTIEYVYGDWSPSSEASDHALRVLAANALPSDMSAYATSWTNGDGAQTMREGSWAYPTKTYEWLKRSDVRVALA